MKILVMGNEERLLANSKPGRPDAHDLVYIDQHADPADIIRAGRDAEILLIDAMGRFTDEEMAGMPGLKMIHSEGVGFQGIDLEAAKKRGIYVCNCKGANASAVAEQALMLMIACLRNAVNCHKAVLDGRQIEVKENYMKTGAIRELADCTVGFIGFGDIARCAAALVKAFGAKAVYYDLYRAPEELEAGAVMKSMDEVLAESDIVSIHLPVTKATENIADAAFFDKKKKGSVFINTARGELVDTPALLAALSDGTLSMAGIDCIAGEPVKKDNPMINAPEEVLRKMIFSPHIAGITGSSFARSYEMFWTNTDRIAAGEKPSCVVNGL